MWSRFHKFIAWAQATSTRVHEPLLSTEAVYQIQLLASGQTATSLHTAHEVLHPLLGERNSVFAGSGLEFADNRQYAVGDDMRFVNWRLWARSGQMYRKLFLEERRPEVWLVMDRRDSMRFGTRQQLKVTQAARVALYYLYRALQQQLACGVILLDKQVQWFKPVRTLINAQPLQQQIIAACPPRSSHDDGNNFGLLPILQQFRTQLTAGSIIVLISDFHDLTPSAATTLYALTQAHTVLATHIADPVEVTAPLSGQYTIQNHDTDQPQLIDGNDPSWRQQWQAILHQQQQQVAATLQNTGVQYQLLLTTTDISNLNGNSHGRSHPQ